MRTSFWHGVSRRFESSQLPNREGQLRQRSSQPNEDFRYFSRDGASTLGQVYRSRLHHGRRRSVSGSSSICIVWGDSDCFEYTVYNSRYLMVHNLPLGSPLNRSRIGSWPGPARECTTHVRLASSFRGFPLMTTVATSWPGCDGPRGSCAINAITSAAGHSAMAAGNVRGAHTVLR